MEMLRDVDKSRFLLFGSAFLLCDWTDVRSGPRLVSAR